MLSDGSGGVAAAVMQTSCDVMVDAGNLILDLATGCLRRHSRRGIYLDAGAADINLDRAACRIGIA